MLIVVNKIQFNIDDDCYPYFMSNSWTVVSSGYLYTTTPSYTYFHRAVIGAKSGELVDHINLDIKDNRRANLRIVTRQQNEANKPKVYWKTTSKYKGVTWNKREKYWVAQIKVNQKGIRLGRFKTEDEAYACRLKAEQKYFGDFAWKPSA